MTTEQFIQRLQDKYKGKIASITQSYIHDLLQYNIQLSEGVDKNTFDNEIIRLINKSDLTDTFDLSISEHGDDFNKMTSSIPVNADFSDSDYLLLPKVEEDDYFEVSIDKKTYGIMSNGDESYAIYFKSEYVGDIYPEITDGGNTIWIGKGRGQTKLSQQLGEAIESHNK
ncbi:hypothetical protein D3C87_1368730 [compost metagenome]